MTCGAFIDVGKSDTNQAEEVKDVSFFSFLISFLFFSSTRYNITGINM